MGAGIHRVNRMCWLKLNLMLKRFCLQEIEISRYDIVKQFMFHPVFVYFSNGLGKGPKQLPLNRGSGCRIKKSSP